MGVGSHLVLCVVFPQWNIGEEVRKSEEEEEEEGGDSGARGRSFASFGVATG